MLNTVEDHISVTLQSYNDNSDMWTHLLKLYLQTNKAQKI